MLTEDSGKHLMGVVDLLQKHSLTEADINVLGENVKAVIQHLQQFTDSTKSKIALFLSLIDLLYSNNYFTCCGNTPYV